MHLLIAGHGKRKNGSFDSGATGHIYKGEHKYMSEDLFPAMKKFLPQDHNLIFFDDYNVYDRGNIVALAKEHGASQVTEFHFDAIGNSVSSGGHVIIYDKYSPDKMDLALRDAIKDMVGIRYNHRGHEGINGRSNLANVTRAANANLTYRLVELGFGTNAEDARIMTEEVESYAKRLVEALVGEAKDIEVKPSKPTKKPPSKPVATSYDGNSVVDYLNSLGQDASYANRRVLATKHGIKNYRGTAEQNVALLNELRGTPTKTTEGSNLTVDSKWGQSTTRALQRALGTPVDGIISNQRRNSVSQSLYGNTVRFSNSGNSNVIVALQNKVGATADGLLGPGTVRALQRYLGTVVDGKLSRPSLVVKEMQRRLNNGTF